VSVEVTVLPNGLTVATDPIPEFGTAAVSVTFGAGSRSEGEAEHGLAHLLEHMAFKGTTRRSALQIAEEIEEVGGDLNAATSVEQTAYDARVLAGDVPLALDILADIVIDPLFDADELKREKGVILQEIGSVDDTPDELVYDLALETAFSAQPLGRPILGTPDTVRALDRSALVGFRGRNYCGNAGVVTASGAVRHAEVVALAEEHFADLRPKAESAASGAARWTGGERRELRDLEQAHLVLACPGLSMIDDDAYALQVFAHILGGGMSSRLFQEVREKRGLVYSIQAFHWAFADTGLFGVYAGTGEGDLDELVPVMLDEIAEATATVNEREVERAKAQMRMSLEMAREQPTSRAERLARQILVYGRPIPGEEILSRLDAVTVEDVRRTGLAAVSGVPSLAAVGPVQRLPGIERFAERLGSARRAA